MTETSGTALETWTVAIDADASGLESQLKDIEVSGKKFSSALTSAFDGLVLKGKSLDQVFSTLALSLSKMVLNAAFKPLTDSLGSALSGLFSGGTSLAFANGGVFQGGLPTPFASGGVIQSPIAFPLGAGTGIAGERGAEAIVPLARSSDGRLGIAASGGGQAMNVTFNVQATDADSFARSQTQIAAMLSRAVALGQRNL